MHQGKDKPHISINAGFLVTEVDTHTHSHTDDFISIAPGFLDTEDGVHSRDSTLHKLDFSPVRKLRKKGTMFSSADVMQSFT